MQGGQLGLIIRSNLAESRITEGTHSDGHHSA